MRLSLPKEALRRFFEVSLDQAFPDGRSHDLRGVIDPALERLEYCFSHIALKGYRDSNGPTFDHLFGDQCSILTYLLANTTWRVLGDEILAKKLSLLNRMRHALLVMYDTELPDIFVIPHTVGTVIGKADYNDYLVICQNVTIANDITTKLTLGRGVVLFPGAFVVGTGCIGDGAVITANTTVTYVDVPPNTIVRGASPNLEMRERKRDFLARYFIPPYPGQ